MFEPYLGISESNVSLEFPVGISVHRENRNASRVTIKRPFVPSIRAKSKIDSNTQKFRAKHAFFAAGTRSGVRRRRVGWFTSQYTTRLGMATALEVTLFGYEHTEELRPVFLVGLNSRYLSCKSLGFMPVRFHSGVGSKYKGSAQFFCVWLTFFLRAFSLHRSRLPRPWESDSSGIQLTNTHSICDVLVLECCP